MAKRKKLTYTIYLDGKQVDELPEWYGEVIAQRFSEAMSEYYGQHRDEWITLCKHLEEEEKNPELELTRLREYN